MRRLGGPTFQARMKQDRLSNGQNLQDVYENKKPHGNEEGKGPLG